MAAYKCGSAKEMFELFFQCSMYASLTHVTSCADGMLVKTPFPMEAFDDRVGFNGFINDFAMPLETGITQNCLFFFCYDFNRLAVLNQE